MNITELTTTHLRQILAIKEQIEKLEAEIDSIVGGEVSSASAEESPVPAKRKYHMTAASRQGIIEMALNTWRQFLIGEIENPGNCEQHMILTDRIADHTCDDMPNNLNRYLLRTVDCDAIRNEDSAIVYVKMCRVMLFGFIHKSQREHWRGTKLHVRKGTIGGTDVTLPGQLLNYFKGRARKVRELDRSLSPRQLEKVRVESEGNIERIVESETFAASLYDIELFGSPE